MRERGDLTGFTGAADDGATATESVAACICNRLWRRYAIGSVAFIYGPDVIASQYNPVGPRANRYPVRARKHSTSDIRAQSNAKPPILRSNRRQATQDSTAPVCAHGNHENANKGKGPDNCPGLW